MIELDVDLGYLLEDGEPDCVTLNDENGEFEPMTFYRGNADAVEFCKRVESAVNERKPLTLFGVDYEVRGECVPHGEWESISQSQEVRHVFCDCGYELGMDEHDLWPFQSTRLFAMPNYCQECGRKIRKAVKR